MLIWLKNQGKVRYRTFQLRPSARAPRFPRWRRGFRPGSGPSPSVSRDEGAQFQFTTQRDESMNLGEFFDDILKNLEKTLHISRPKFSRMFVSSSFSLPRHFEVRRVAEFRKPYWLKQSAGTLAREFIPSVRSYFARLDGCRFWDSSAVSCG